MDRLLWRGLTGPQTGGNHGGLCPLVPPFPRAVPTSREIAGERGDCKWSGQYSRALGACPTCTALQASGVPRSEDPLTTNPKIYQEQAHALYMRLAAYTSCVRLREQISNFNRYKTAARRHEICSRKFPLRRWFYGLDCCARRSSEGSTRLVAKTFTDWDGRRISPRACGIRKMFLEQYIHRKTVPTNIELRYAWTGLCDPDPRGWQFRGGGPDVVSGRVVSGSLGFGLG